MTHLYSVLSALVYSIKNHPAKKYRNKEGYTTTILTTQVNIRQLQGTLDTKRNNGSKV